MQARARYAKNSEDPAWREQNAARVMKWQQENPDKVAEKVKRNKLARPAKYQRMALKAHLKCRYNITIEDYEALVKRAGNCCEICGVHQDDLSEKLCVDHCHETGKVRGLLCKTCNSAIGRLGDTYEMLQKAADFLRERG